METGTTTTMVSTAEQTDESVVPVSITTIIQQHKVEDDCGSSDDSEVSTQVVVTSPTTDVSGSHYIVTVPDDEEVHPSYVHYTVDGSEQAIFATTTNGQITYPVFAAVGENYTTTSGQYYSGNTTAVTYAQVGPTGQSIITGNTYLIQPGVEQDTQPAPTIIPTRNTPDTVSAQEAAAAAAAAAAVAAAGSGSVYVVTNTSPAAAAAVDAAERSGGSGSGPGSGNATAGGVDNMTHATRVSPATVQWLLENYECAEGVSLPRSTMYAHYLRHCTEHKLDPVNAASFGKLIRSVFLGLRTRRLGTRGNSKYHYYGIRIKPGSNLTRVSDEPSNTTSRPASTKRLKQNNSISKNDSQYESGHNTSPQTHDNQQFLGDGVGAIPEFPPLTLIIEGDSDLIFDDVDTFKNIYREHCEAFLEAVLNLEFQTVESLWREFWRSHDNNNGDECEEEKYLSKSKLYSLCKLDAIQQFIQTVDFIFYQNIVQVLIPDVLRAIPSSLTQSIRNFAKGLENWLTGAMSDCPEEMVKIKLSAVSALAQTLRRYTSLNHLAQAARAVLQNSSQISQMLADLNRVDFHNVQEQASWVCECDDGVVQRLEADFKATLQQQNSLETWALWLKNVVSQVLKPYEGKPNFAKAARQFLLKWSFYSSMVIRDLTLRSAASFGSFHLIRLLYDEYMFYLVEHQVALATGEPPIAVMGDRCQKLDVQFQSDIKRMKLS